MPLLELGEGVFKTHPSGGEDTTLQAFLSQHSAGHNVTITGKGPGITEIHGKMDFNGWYPNLRRFSMYPDETQRWVLIDIENPGTFLIEDVWLHPPSGTLGLAVRANDGGLVPGVVHWPPRNNPIGGARISVSMMRDIYAYGEGRGIEVANELTEEPANGQFTNHVRIDGGHIRTTDTALSISGEPWNVDQCVVRNFHIDVVTADKGLRFGGNTHITWYAPGHVEPGSAIKASGGNFINGPRENLTIVGDWPRPFAI